ncbi:glycosyltransferase [Gammaproteobacteria bacterium]|jgi:glycosyltransferase involved in cell wall biosynthesis|nr:glycosyltransferase [Gammaproteobacteria bacterium]|tara:strand:+ start:769 stop:1749 length:981 start_codon:yes stop_codon:yes gene_type:complete
MINNKLVTVCIATYNRSETVCCLVQELLDFELNDQIEILVIDDCSPDNTYEDLSQFSHHQNVTILKNDTNLSRARTQLRYFNICKTEYLIELPDDELLYKEGLLELLLLLPTLDVDFLSTRWMDTTGLFYGGRGSDDIQEISLTNLRIQSEHSIGCVFRASILKLSEEEIVKRLEQGCAAAFFYHQNIVLLIAKLNNLKLLSSSILLGGYRPEGPLIGQFTDAQGNCYTSLSAAFNKYLGMKSLYEDSLMKFSDTQFADELAALSASHTLSIYSVVEDALGYNNDSESTTLVTNLQAGSVRNFMNPIKALRHLLKFITVKFTAWKY